MHHCHLEGWLCQVLFYYYLLHYYSGAVVLPPSLLVLLKIRRNVALCTPEEDMSRSRLQSIHWNYDECLPHDFAEITI